MNLRAGQGVGKRIKSTGIYKGTSINEPRNTEGFMNSINGGVTVTAAITNRKTREKRERGL